MVLEVDLQTCPPTVTLGESDDFDRFKVLLRSSSHAWVALDQLKHLAGEHAQDPAWLGQLERMVDYGRARGFVDEADRIRAHIECLESES